MSVSTYQLYLSTQITSPATNNVVPVDISQKANAKWQVNFRALFGNSYGKYKRCSVRAMLMSENFGSSATDWNTYNGYLAINLLSNNNATTTLGTPLMLLNVIQTATLTTAKSAYLCSTLSDANGVDIAFPAENQFINIMFVNNDAMTLMTATTQAIPDYQLILQFELSEPF